MRAIANEIIEKAAMGDMAAFEEIYQTYSSQVYSIAMGIVHDTHDADEVTQDVFVKLFKSLKSFRFASSFGTWVYRIAVNASLNMYKSKMRRDSRKADLAEVDEMAAPAGASQEDPRASHDAGEKIHKMLQYLNPAHRSCIVLRDIEGLEYKSIADILGIPLNTVRSRLKRARQALILYCRKEGIRHEM